MTLSAQELQSKRKFPRRRFPRSVGFLFNGDYVVGVGSEVGEGGIALYLGQEYPMNTEGVVSFQIPGGSFICVRVELRNLQQEHNDGVIIGCAFKNLTFEHRREIRAYVSARSEFE
jgi:hypothetical protein